MNIRKHQKEILIKAGFVLSLSSLLIITSASTEANGGDSGLPKPVVVSIVDKGSVPRPAQHAGRGGGFSVNLNGRSVWTFGNTFLPHTAEDGLRWRSSTWSWTLDQSSEDGLGPFEHTLGPDGMALQLLPHTPEEAAFNLAHESKDGCMAEIACGSYITPWAAAVVTDLHGQEAVIFYSNMHIGPVDEWDFRSISGSVATWDDPEAPAVRVEPPLFSDEEPDWGSAALLVGDDIYVYACDYNGSEKPCLLARVPFHAATTRSAYRFWAGDGVWSVYWQDAIPLFAGDSSFSVLFNTYLDQYLAFYMAGLGSEIFLRTADHPEGPWSEPLLLGQGEKACTNWDFGLIAHPEFARENGRVQILSYTRPAGFLTQEVRLLELQFE